MKADGADLPTSAENRRTADMAWRAVSTLTAGMLLYGGLGWLVGGWVGHRETFMAVGLLIGIGLALYVTNARLTGGRRTP
jgi:F0F1-type ATP synthase assembly protein I